MNVLDMISSGDGTPEQYVQFKCPGCGSTHCLGVGPKASGPRWSWNGDTERPTFTPSVLVTWREPTALGDPEELQAQLDRKRRDGTPIPQSDRCCHSFVADGRIQFLGDCTHELAGQTVDIPAWSEE